VNPTVRWLWLGQLISNLGTQCSLFGIGLWSFERRGQLLGFAAVAFVVQLAKVLVLPLLGRRMGRWPPRRLMLIANGIGAVCTTVLAGQLLLLGHPQPLLMLPLLALAAMAEAALVLAFASLIPLLEEDPHRLARANGLFVSSDGLVLSMAPFLGSALVAGFGLAGVLLLDGLSFAVATVCVLAARWPAALQSPMAEVAPSAGQALVVPPGGLRLRWLWRHSAARPVLVLGTAMAFVYASIDVLFPAWLIAGPGRDRLVPGLLLCGLGYGLGLLLWGRLGWRRPGAVLVICLALQSLILMGAGLLVFEQWLLFWYGGLLVFSLALPLALAALQTRWQHLVAPGQLPHVLSQRYRLEWAARLLAFLSSALLADAVLVPLLTWPGWPGWLVAGLGQGPGRSLAVSLGAMGWVLLLALLLHRRVRMRT
jgi:DHA3 family macrolide efflux protein-like MFS transporter